jgi:CheY-like chemotaxis protein
MPAILIIDDEEIVIRYLQSLLQKEGYQIFIAPNGKEARRIYEESALDLVITDILMPEMDGIEVIRDLRKRNGAIKILAVSGGGQTGRLDFLSVARNLGADKILHKPFTNTELITAISELLGSPPASSQA